MERPLSGDRLMTSSFAVREVIFLRGGYQILQGFFPHADTTTYKAFGVGKETHCFSGEPVCGCNFWRCASLAETSHSISWKGKGQKEAITQMYSHLKYAAFKNLDRDCRMGTDWRLFV